MAGDINKLEAYLLHFHANHDGGGGVLEATSISVGMCLLHSRFHWPFDLRRLSYWKGVPMISARGIAPSFGGCAFE
jgi:hypothetical protein